MKTKNPFLILVLLIAFLISGSGCRVIYPQYREKTITISTNPSGKVPPGQMKKMTGEKSAKNYAPGQVKKRNKKKYK